MTDSPQIDMFSSIVWATDGSDASLAGSRFVRGTCERYGSRLRLVHVAPTLCTAADERRIAGLKALTSSLRRHGIDASLHVVRGAIGSPAPHIAEVARMSQAKLVIVGTRGRSPVVSAVAGSVAQRLLAESSCPVLVLPATSVGAHDRRPVVAPALAAPA
jgi:nucleotide-binding universal stress UspA family protein